MRALVFTTAVVGALIGSGSMGASATPAHPVHYRPIASAWSGRGDASSRRLPPISGVWHVRPGERGGYLSGRAMHEAERGPAIYDVRRHGLRRQGRGAYASAGYDYGTGAGYDGLGYAGQGPAIYDVRHGGLHRERRRDEASAGYGYAYGPVGAGDGGYGAPAGRLGPESLDRGAPAYGGQGFVSLATCYACGPVAYQASYDAYGYGDGYGYGVAGGLGVYSPGAFGPGPRIITIPARYNVGLSRHRRHAAARR